MATITPHTMNSLTITGRDADAGSVPAVVPVNARLVRVTEVMLLAAWATVPGHRLPVRERIQPSNTDIAIRETGSNSSVCGDAFR